METPELPKNHFFRVVPGGYEPYGITGYNAAVQIRRRILWVWSCHVFSTTIKDTVRREPKPAEIHEAMLRVRQAWEEHNAHISPYGDYPPKKLS